jgi:hypothetical protein
MIRLYIADDQTPYFTDEKNCIIKPSKSNAKYSISDSDITECNNFFDVGTLAYFIPINIHIDPHPGDCFIITSSREIDNNKYVKILKRYARAEGNLEDREINYSDLRLRLNEIIQEELDV